MNDTNRLWSSAAAAKRRDSWRRVRMHRISDRHLDTVELIGELKARAERREEQRRSLICNIMDLHRIPNTVADHTRAIDMLWTPRILHYLGTRPDPATLVIWRKQAAAAAKKSTSARRQRSDSN